MPAVSLQAASASLTGARYIMLLSRSPGGATVAPVLPPAVAAKLQRYCRCTCQCRPHQCHGWWSGGGGGVLLMLTFFGLRSDFE